MGADCLPCPAPAAPGPFPQEPGAALLEGVRPAPRPSHTSLAPQGRLVLSNKMARTISFFYTLFLHCLVFLVSIWQVVGKHSPRPQLPGAEGTLVL